jgi:hypothetical protein
MNNVKIFVSVIVILVVGVIATALLRGTSTPAGPGKLDNLAQCISDKGAVFYGAFWCSHCQAQKKLFGSSAKLLPYVECSTPDGRGQLQVCRDKNIEGYPTWRFADGTELNGAASLEDLAQKTSCALPE